MRARLGGTLQARLTVLLVAVLLLTTGVIGVVTTLALRVYLTGRLDDQLLGAGGRYSLSLEYRDADGDADDAVPGQSVGTLGVRLVDGRVAQAAVVDEAGGNAHPVLSAADVAAMRRLPVGGPARTVDLDRLHDYRLVAVAAADGAVQVTGLPEAEVDATLRRLVAIESGLIGTLILAAAFVVAVLVRRTLRPLRRIADTAEHVAGLPLTTAATPLPTGLAPAHPTSEVDQVGTAFEQMLDHIRSALGARDATEQRLRQFVADASHELRTPLATIRVNAESLQRSAHALPDPVAASLARIDGATARMTALVEDLLLLARLDDELTQQLAPTDLTRLVLEAVVDARALAPGHHWRLDLPDDPVQVAGEAARLHRVVTNLVGNAHQHTPPGTTVTISMAVALDTVTLVVADDGPGIPGSLQSTLFDRFTRGDASRSSSSGSTGLGLAIAYGVVTAHGGTLEVVSVPGRTAFTVRLPRRGRQGTNGAVSEVGSEPLEG